MKSATEIFALCGGVARVAEACGVSPQAVSNWKLRGAIPAWHLRTLHALSNGHISYEDLVALRPGQEKLPQEEAKP